jgi:hypothetical protein
MKDEEKHKEELKENKTWQYWCTWLGIHIDESGFNEEGLKDLEKISYHEFIKRLKTK